MGGLLQSAWLGWRSYINDGKLMAPALASLLYLWIGRKRGGRPFVLYGLVMTVCCILPVTAAGLMVYQTGFYNYEQIWSFVPVTAVTAYGFTVVLAECWTDFKPAHWRKGVPVAAFLLAAALFSSSLGVQAWDMEGEKREREQADAALGQLLEMCPEEGICLWAPREIVEYAREGHAAIRLVYGRDMWNSSLVGYTYDTYDENKVRLYQWMEMNPKERTPQMNRLAATLALEEGVNCVLLPGDTALEVVRNMGTNLGADIRLIGNYFFLVARVHAGEAYE